MPKHILGNEMHVRDFYRRRNLPLPEITFLLVLEPVVIIF